MGAGARGEKPKQIAARLRGEQHKGASLASHRRSVAEEDVLYGVVDGVVDVHVDVEPAAGVALVAEVDMRALRIGAGVLAVQIEVVAA